MKKVTGRLEGWHIDNIFPTIIWGHVFEDSKDRFRDGTRIHTSHIKTPPEQWVEGAIVETLNSTYLLGKKL